MGDSCKSTSDCRYPDSHCENSICGCREGYRSYDVKGFHTGCIRKFSVANLIIGMLVIVIICSSIIYLITGSTH